LSTESSPSLPSPALPPWTPPPSLLAPFPGILTGLMIPKVPAAEAAARATRRKVMR
jgi:hypothetical protein